MQRTTPCCRANLRERGWSAAEYRSRLTAVLRSSLVRDG